MIFIMALLPILTYPDPRLRTIAEPVVVIDDSVKELIDDMFETMYHARGIGLAATQIDRHIQLIVMDLAKKDEKPDPRVFINPTLSDPSDTLAPYEEGCLSIPEVYDEILRPEQITIHATDQHGNKFTETATGLLAVCIQHEMDHLNGVLFVDYLSRLKQTRAKDKVKKVLKKRNNALTD